jgi:class 3 adenylate cyclase
VAPGPGEPEAELPAGTVTFLLTDIEGSTRLWESVPAAMEVALDRHNQLLTGVIEGHGGVVVTSRGEGDSFFAVFPGAVAAVQAAGSASWPWGGRRGPRGRFCGCGWGCIPGRPGRPAATVLTMRRSTGVPG